MKLICLFEFETQNDGISKMQNFDYPCAFIVGNDTFDYQGNPIVISETYFTAPNNTMDCIIGFGDDETLDGLAYVQDNICKVNKVN